MQAQDTAGTRSRRQHCVSRWFDAAVDALAACGHWLGTFGQPWV
jgi:hypothetical protein